MIKKNKRINCLKFFIDALIEVTKDIDNESNYNSKDLNRSGINKSIDEEQLRYSNQVDYNKTNKRFNNDKEFNIKLILIKIIKKMSIIS